MLTQEFTSSNSLLQVLGSFLIETGVNAVYDEDPQSVGQTADQARDPLQVLAGPALPLPEQDELPQASAALPDDVEGLPHPVVQFKF